MLSASFSAVNELWEKNGIDNGCKVIGFRRQEQQLTGMIFVCSTSKTREKWEICRSKHRAKGWIDKKHRQTHCEEENKLELFHLANCLLFVLNWHCVMK